MTLFEDRQDAGTQLAAAVADLNLEGAVTVVGLPRGGVPVAAAVAAALDAPLDVILVRKVGHPRHREYAIGAIAEGGVEIANESEQRRLDPDEVASAVRRARRELDERADLYRGARRRHALAGRTVVVVDDGLATGATARSALRAVRRIGASKAILAVPVASRRGLRSVEGVAHQVVCLHTPDDFRAVGQFYADFAPTTDDEVRAFLTD